MTNTTPSSLRLLSSPEPSSAPPDFTEALEAFSRRLEAEGRSENTISAYLRDLSYLSEALLRRHPGIVPDEVTNAMVDEALTSPEVTTSAGGGVRSPASMHRFKAAVRSFFTWAEQNGIVRENPAGSLTLRRLPRTPPKFLTEAEKRRLLKELRGRASSLAVRDRVIIEVFLGTGIRLQELVDLDIEDVDLDAKHLRVLAKGSVPQVKFLKHGSQAVHPGRFSIPAFGQAMTEERDSLPTVASPNTSAGNDAGSIGACGSRAEALIERTFRRPAASECQRTRLIRHSQAGDGRKSACFAGRCMAGGGVIRPHFRVFPLAVVFRAGFFWDSASFSSRAVAHSAGVVSGPWDASPSRAILVALRSLRWQRIIRSSRSAASQSPDSCARPSLRK